MNPLLQILGRLLTDEPFRTALRANTETALSQYGFVLTARQHEIAANIAHSLRSGRLDAAVAAVIPECPIWPCPEMRHTLWQILGGMLVHQSFRTAVIENRSARLSRDGYLLTPHHEEILSRIVTSFVTGRMDDAVQAVSDECPVWPCPDPLMQA
jgi:hypothetical protein